MRTVLTKSKRADGLEHPSRSPLVAIVDDDQSVREALERLLHSAGFSAQVFAPAEDLIRRGHLGQTKCLVLHLHMPGMSGLEHHARLVLLTLTPPHDRTH